MPGLPRSRVVAGDTMTARSAPSFSARSVFNASALVFAASMMLSVGGFAFHAIASRKLGVSDYGALYALISLYSLAIVPIGLFSPVVTKYAAEFGALHDDSHVRGLIDLVVRGFAFFGLAYIVAAVAFAVPLGAFLKIPGWEIPVVGGMCAIGVLSVALRAVAQGVHDYRAYGLSMASEGIGKVIVLAIFAILGLTIFRGTLAFLIGMGAGACFAAAPLVRRYSAVVSSPIVLDWKRIFATTIASTSVTLTMTLMGFGDVIIVKHFFPSDQAGLYSAVSLCAKILFYFVGFVPAILIPQATHRHARGERTRRTLWAAVIFVSVVSLAGVVFYRFFGYIVLHALVGKAFDGGLPLLPTYAGAMAFLAITTTLGAYAMATHRLAFIAPLLIATVGTLGAIALVHPSLAVVTQELLVGNAVMLAALGIPLAIQGLRQSPQ
jgi:O-antigen/teichoic acid export membrane protein